MRTKALLITCVLILPMLLSSCARQHANYGEGGRSVAPLTIPAGVSNVKQEDYYPLPQTPIRAATAPSIIPPGSRVVEYQQMLQQKKAKR